MLKSFLFGGVFLLCSAAWSQDLGEETVAIMKSCNCDEIIMISGALEKSYTASWLDNIDYKNGFIIFTKGEHQHNWSGDKVVFVEKGARFIRVYLNQAK